MASSEALRSRIEDLTGQLEVAKDELKNLENDSRSNVKGAAAAPKRASSVLSTFASGKSGYLYKWQDRSIGWGGTKWGLRFVSLEGGKLSYKRSHADAAPRYMMTLRRCAIQDDGNKRNRRHTTKERGGKPDASDAGAYFHVFSIYQRPAAEEAGADVSATADDESRIIPLLRFSTPSLAEKEQWMNLLSEVCAYCDSDEFLEDEAAAATQSIKSNGVANGVSDFVGGRGTLPPLIFAAAPPQKPLRVPSGLLLHSKQESPKWKGYVRKSKMANSAKSNISAYPPSKPMHRAAAPSYLSDEAPIQNFRGLFNLGLLVLVISNVQLLLDTVKQYGFVLSRLRDGLDLSLFMDAPLAHFPFLTGVGLLQCFIVYTYFIELLLSRGVLNEMFGMALHYLNGNCALFVPIFIVWNFISSPAVGGILLFHASITWMKLISYVAANEDYRTNPERDSHKQTIALIQNLDEEEKDISYPQNVTLKNMYYYWVAPTLTYQIVFPRSPKIRWMKVVGIVFRFAVAIVFFLFLVAQVVSPKLNELVTDLEKTGDGVFSPHILADYILTLSIAITYRKFMLLPASPFKNIMFPINIVFLPISGCHLRIT